MFDDIWHPTWGTRLILTHHADSLVPGLQAPREVNRLQFIIQLFLFDSILASIDDPT